MLAQIQITVGMLKNKENIEETNTITLSREFLSGAFPSHVHESLEDTTYVELSVLFNRHYVAKLMNALRFSGPQEFISA